MADDEESEQVVVDEPSDEEGTPGPDALKARVEDLETEVAELQDKLKRALAEEANVRKRADREVKAARAEGRRDLLQALLPVLDDLDRALALGGRGEAGTEGPGDLDPDGLRMVRDELWKTLEAAGLSPIEAGGARFDPALHEAVGRVETDARPDGAVVEEVQRGYALDGRVLRPAKVTVARAPAEGGPDDADHADDPGADDDREEE